MDGSQLALTLSIRNADALANGSPLTLVLEGRGCTIGRASSNDWPLPDPERHLSSRHCEIRFDGGGYELIDSSTNGTFVNGAAERLSGPYRLSQGDVLQIGPYEIVAALASAKASVAPQPAPPAPATSPPPATPTPPPTSSPAPGPSAEAEPPPNEARRQEMWTMFSLSNEVDWARGGFGTPAAVPPLEPGPAAATEEPASAGEETTATGGLDVLLSGAEISRDQLKQDDNTTLRQAGVLLRRLIAGLVVMLEARARAKSQMGAQGTGLEIEGNNPLKFARSPEQALQYMLNPRERGFMSAERAIEDGLRDLQAHQLATLRAMQGALRSTLDRFSPKSIRARADTRGLLERLLPGSRDAALWKAYEKEFSGVAFDSDEAFMDMFAKEFRQAYDEIARER